MKRIFFLITFLRITILGAQDYPAGYSISYDGTRFFKGQSENKWLYQDNIVRRLDLTFKQSNWKSLLTSNYQSKTEIPADLIINGKTYTNVGVRYKGQTSYQRVSGDKKSFAITVDFQDSTQDINGYESLNLNNSFEDQSFMREAFYQNYTRKYTPSLKVAYVHLYINGEDYGLYPNVQNLDGEYIKEWFLNNNGSRWRCERQGGATGGGPGGGGGGGFGAGTSSLNFLGDDKNLYTSHYSLRKTEMPDPWGDIMRSTKVLANVTNADSLNSQWYIDETLWFLAKEILFGDDDSYVNKGGMDYYAYFDAATGRMCPLEYDANTVMGNNAASWDIFLKSSSTQFPLCNKLFNIPELRQRYLAHVRTIANDLFQPTNFNAFIDKYFNLIDSVVKNDPKKLMTYDQFVAGKGTLKTWMTNRRNFILNNTEVKQTGTTISSVSKIVNGIVDALPNANQSTLIKTKTAASTKAKSVLLYYSTGYDGKYTRLKMFDDGAHQDEAANDGIFTASIPAHSAGTYIRYYVEAIADNAFNTATYFPEGAEHDVFIYRVNLESSSNTGVVINEVMSANTKSAKDQDNEYDDWIELYNTTNSDINISRWILTDNQDNLDKYRIPNNTIIKANSYLIIWADEDGKQTGLHANFKLSASGEQLILLDSTMKQVDIVTIPALADDQAYARQPNGTGAFVIKAHSFNKNNDTTTPLNESKYIKTFILFPNPAHNTLYVELSGSKPSSFMIVNLMGQKLYQQTISKTSIDISSWPKGSYIATSKGQSIKFVVL